MRWIVFSLLCILASVLWAQGEEPQRIFTRLPTEAPPELRQNRTFVPVRAVTETFGATATWQPADRMVLIQRANHPDIRLTIGSRTAQAGDKTVTLDAAPYLSQGRTMVPLRFIAETYGVPTEYNAQTQSVLLHADHTVYVLPLESTRTGIYIYDPPPNVLVRNPVLVQGQANVFEGALIIEVRDTHGRVLGRTTATAGMGGFYPFSTHIYYNLPSEDAIDGLIVVYAQDGRGNGHILAQASVRVRLASTI